LQGRDSAMPLRTAMRSGIEFVHSCLRSRVAWLVASIHGAWFFLAVANMSPPSPMFANFLDSLSGSSTTIFAGRPFHFTYESMTLKSLFVADLPSSLAQVPLGISLSPVIKDGSPGHIRGVIPWRSYLLCPRHLPVVDHRPSRGGYCCRQCTRQSGSEKSYPALHDINCSRRLSGDGVCADGQQPKPSAKLPPARSLHALVRQQNSKIPYVISRRTGDHGIPQSVE
jgi:hypothetical protein